MSNEQNQNKFDELSWKPSEYIDSLDKLYKYVLTETNSAMQWYSEKRRNKKVWGCGLRIGAVIATGVAGIIPVISQIAVSVNTLWATVAIAIAAILIALDRFAGFTSGWVRYMLAELEINQIQEAFYFDWEKSRFSYAETDPTPEQVKESLSQCKDFLLKVRGVVNDETSLWASEFQTALKEIEKATKVTMHVRKQIFPNKNYVDGIEFFDVYRGKQIEKGKKSIAFRLIFRADDRTLKSEEVDKLQEEIVENLSNIFGIKLRA